MEYHPKTKKHYIHVIEPVPTFLDVLGSYRRLSQKCKWMSVIHQERYKEHFAEYDKADNVIILWHDQEIPKTRKAKIVIHYSEMVGKIETFDCQRTMLNKFINRINNYDAILVHSLMAKDYLKKYKQEVEYIPIGYDHKIYGKPNFEVKKEYDLLFYGSPVGRRIEVINYLKDHFRDRLHTTSLFGEKRQEILNKSRINLMIPWSKNCSLTSMRLIQSIGSSAAFLTEKHDTYPAIANEHYIEITDFDNKSKSIDEIEQALKQDVSKIAAKAHADLSKVTTLRCMDMLINYLASI